MKPFTAMAIMWIATTIAVSISVYITKSAWCLWGMFIPACVGFKSGSDDKDE